MVDRLGTLKVTSSEFNVVNDSSDLFFDARICWTGIVWFQDWVGSRFLSRLKMNMLWQNFILLRVEKKRKACSMF